MLHIIANQYTLTEFLLDSLPAEQRASVVHMHPRRIKGAVYSVLKAVDAWLPWRLPGFLPYPVDYLHALEALPPDTPVLIFGIENIKDLRIVRKHLRTRQIALFTWNPVTDYQQHPGLRRIHLWLLKRLRFQLFTFDPADAANYGLTLVPQVYRRMKYQAPPTPPQWDIYFLGRDKGRFRTLQYLAPQWQKQGLHVHLRMTPEPDTVYPPVPGLEVVPRSIDYSANVDAILQTRCLLEIVQANQTGPTIRCMEALFFDKKLITNNAAVRSQPFYDPSRIHILGHDAPESLASFLRRPSAPVAPEVLQAHDFPYWLARFTPETMRAELRHVASGTALRRYGDGTAPSAGKAPACGAPRPAA